MIEFYRRPPLLREPPPEDEPPPDERKLPLLLDEAGARYVPEEDGAELRILLLDERELLLDERTLLLLDEAGARYVPEDEAVEDEREERTVALLLAVEPVLPDAASRTPELLWLEADAREVPCAEAVADAREARAVLIALDDSRVLLLPKVRAAADARASPAERDTRVPFSDSAVDAPREAVRTGLPAAAVTLPRDDDARVSRCN